MTLSRRTLLGMGLVTPFVIAGCGGERRFPVARGTAERPLQLQPAPVIGPLDRPRWIEAAKAWLVVVPLEVRARARAFLPAATSRGMEWGLLALSAHCPQGDTDVQFCSSAGWFECPACGSQFDGLGAHRAGPAPAGLAMLEIEVNDVGEVSVVERPDHPGLAPDLQVWDHPARGPHCT